MPATVALATGLATTSIFDSDPTKTAGLASMSDLVDLRVIVLACNRPDALSMLLTSLDNLVLDGATASLEIWIDRNKNGTVHNATSHVAHSFAWSRGVTRVHVWPRHVGIYGQWIDTWCPAVTDEDGRSGEMALILEEDLVVSPYAWRWLRAARQAYGNRTDLAGYSLQSENVYCAAADKKRQALSVQQETHCLRLSRARNLGFCSSPVALGRVQDVVPRHARQ
jgi:hypothetical protein